jgi:hypothetical protein
MPLSDLYNICERCGRAYINFCVVCAKADREEMVEELMEKYGLTIDRLIHELSGQVLTEKNLAALKLAIELRDMKPATKADITSDRKPLGIDDDVKARILSKINKLAKSGSEG